MKRISCLLGLGFMVCVLNFGVSAFEKEPFNEGQSVTDPLLAAMDGRIMWYEGRRNLNHLQANTQNQLLPPYIRAYYESWYNRYINKHSIR